LDKSILKTTSRFNCLEKQCKTDLLAVESTVSPRFTTTAKRLVLSETDLNKSSSLAHNYDRQFTVRVGPIWSDQTCKLHYLGHTSVSIMPGSWSDQQRYRKDCMYNGTIMPHAKPYKRSRDHTREPNKAIWNIAPHCETTNQHACLSESTAELRSGIRTGKKRKEKPSTFLH